MMQKFQIECKPFIEQLKILEKGTFLSRGVHTQNVDFKKYKFCINERTPKNMPLEVHNAINDYYDNIFGWKIRNGLFTYGIKSPYDKKDLGYGRTHLFFPCNDNFQYALDPNNFDLFFSHIMFKKNNDSYSIDSFIKTLNITNKDLGLHMSNIVMKERSVEIMFNCSAYYLIDIKYSDELIKYIWG